MRIAILCNGATVSAWQLEAIRRIAGDHELYILTGGVGQAAKRKPAHALYYALNMVTIRNRLTAPVPFPTPEFTVRETLGFQESYERGWAVLPGEVAEWLREHSIDVVLKFGLGLLRVPDDFPVPILSYHHGDPRAYRGRPAGFYEIADGTAFHGQIVQILSNKLDGGAVVAFAQSRVEAHSYKQTLLNAYRLSPYLLPKAIEAIRTGEVLPIGSEGRNYRLPSNLTVAQFVVRGTLRKVRRLAYGAFIEKRWSVATARTRATEPLESVREASGKRANWSVPAITPGYSFFADPFFHSASDDVLVEAMNRRSGKGELVRLRGEHAETVEGFDGHLSYPQSISHQGQLYVVPEIAGWSRPGIYRLDGQQAQRVADLDLDEESVVDPTLFEHEGRIYLFGNRRTDGANVLHLWSADDLFGCFEPHPASPIRVGARGSRMAGEIVVANGTITRLGQDFRRQYGDGILAFRIETLTRDDYRETLLGEAAFDGVEGPHTVNARDGVLLFDFYREKFSPFAGVRRLLNRL